MSGILNTPYSEDYWCPISVYPVGLVGYRFTSAPQGTQLRIGSGDMASGVVILSRVQTEVIFSTVQKCLLIKFALGYFLGEDFKSNMAAQK